MPLLRKKGLLESSRVLFLPLSEISPNPNQPRRNFSQEGLVELAASIQEHGVLQPLSVRRTAGGYELIAGERRLRASRLAGLKEVPCILLGVDEEASSLLALVENLQRRDLDFLEEANALSVLIHTYHLSQEEAARRIGKSQSAVANKLRLLRLAPEVLTLLRDSGCTERHARALLRLELETGRTHQIRVHMASLGCPLTGDFLYGTEERALISRPALHSARLSLRHPITGAALSWQLPLPEDMKRLLE